MFSSYPANWSNYNPFQWHGCSTKHIKHFCCWSQSVCKWIIQYSEVVNGIIRGEQTFKLSVYHSRWEDAGLVFVNALLIPLELSHSFTPMSGREALNPLVCILENQYRTIKDACEKLSLAASVQIFKLHIFLHTRNVCLYSPIMELCKRLT